MAVETETLADINILPEQSSEGNQARETPGSTAAIQEPGPVRDTIQVPSTAPPVAEVHRNTNKPIQKLIHTQTGPLDRSSEPQDSDDAEGSVSDGDLASFDWHDFRARYTEELIAINAEEDLLLKEFDNLAEVFGIWAEAGAEYDNDRALKRLKTRENYVQIAETSLAGKKNHYVQVVDAFRKALDLLRS